MTQKKGGLFPSRHIKEGKRKRKLPQKREKGDGYKSTTQPPKLERKMFDTTTLKGLNEALEALDALEPENDADAHRIAQWIWDNCDHDEEVSGIVLAYSLSRSELEAAAEKVYRPDYSH